MKVCRTALDDGSVSTAVVEAVADALGVQPCDVDPPLYRAIDPDALDDLFDSTRDADGAARVAFTYADCEVTVTGRGEVVVRPASESDGERTA